MLTNFILGCVGPTAANMIKNNQRSHHKIQLERVPAHAGNPGNGSAHRVARGLINREVKPSALDFPQEGISTYNKITAYYRENRKTNVTPHTDLTRKQATIWRQIQTSSFPSPHRLSKIYPEDVRPHRKHCGYWRATRNQILRECEGNPPPNTLLPASSLMEWKSLLWSTDHRVQAKAVTWAETFVASYWPPLFTPFAR